jgi:glycosyltransferase involved in cell wall biosynthesis/GT2 family glycosyltransferase
MAGDIERAYRSERFRHPSPPPTRSTNRDVAVLIVAFRNPQMLRKCLAASNQHLPAMPILVWDNSGPGYPGIEEIVSGHPTVRWFLGSRNIGFAAAVNSLAREVPEHDLLLLNPDAMLQGPLTRTFAALRKAGVAAAAPLTIDDKAEPERYRSWDVAHRKLNLTRALVAWAGYSYRVRGRRWSELYREQPQFVDGYLTGACLAISRDAWNAVGSFDEEFFLYGEEADWQRRARAVGWSLVLVDELGVVHTGHGTVADDPVAALRSRDLLRANTALYLELEKGSGQANLYLAGTSVLERVQRSARRERAARRRSVGARPAIIMTTNRPVYGGAERQRIQLATELAERGYEVVFACMQRFGPLLAEIPASIRVVRQPWWSPAVDVNAGKSVMVTGDTYTEIGFGALWRAGRGRRWLVAGHRAPHRFGPTYSRALAAAMRRSDGFVVLSRTHWREATAYQNLGPRFFVAPNGVASAADLEARPRRPPPSTQPHLVMFSRMVEHENPHILIEALDGLRELPWRVSVFGDGPDRERLRSMTPARLADRVAWRGYSPGPDQALSDCDLLCVPSRLDAFPVVILEAMARRVPVAASAVCSVGELLDDGRAGILVRDASVEEWRAALDTALRNTETWNDLGDKGFEQMQTRYSVEAMADAYESAITAVL